MHLMVFTSIASTFLYGLIFDWRLMFIQATIIMLYFLGSRSYSKTQKTSVRRKIAMSSWGQPSEPSCYGNMEINAEKIDIFIEKYNEANPKARISYTHVFLSAIGKAFAKVPGINGKLVFGNFVPFHSVDINTLVSVNDGKNLNGVTVRNCDTLNLAEIRSQVNAMIKKTKTNKDDDFKEQVKMGKMLPACILSLLIALSSFISYSLGISVGLFRLKKHSFGSIILTNVTKMNVTNTFAPLVNFAQSICVIVMCKPELRPVVDEHGEIVVRKMMNVNVTFDHRYADGHQGSLLVEEIYHALDNLD